MGTPHGVVAQFVTIDPAAAADELAAIFRGLSQALDAFRVSPPPGTPREQLARMKDEAQALDDRAHHFTAESIGATLQSIQADLTHIKQVTTDAKAQLELLNDVSKVIQIATSAVSVGAAIAAGNPAAILAATEALAQSLVA
jgi:hypothetical protein